MLHYIIMIKTCDRQKQIYNPSSFRSHDYKNWRGSNYAKSCPTSSSRFTLLPFNLIYRFDIDIWSNRNRTCPTISSSRFPIGKLIWLIEVLNVMSMGIIKIIIVDSNNNHLISVIIPHYEPHDKWIKNKDFYFWMI